MEAVAILHDNATNVALLLKEIINNKFNVLVVDTTKSYSVFTPKVLENFIREEEIHERNTFSLVNQHIRTLSGGEQKKALLEYLIAKKPEILLLDNPFDHLDVASRESLANRLEALAASITLILVTSRKNDIPDFITKTYVYTNKGTLTPYTNTVTNEQNAVTISIPPPVAEMEYENEFIIEAKNIQVSYGTKHIIQAINWSIRKGEFWQLIGPNGSGKTTLLSMITGDNVKGYGQELYIFGNKKGTGESVWELKNKIGYFTTNLTQQFTGRNTAREMIIGGFFDAVGLYNKPTDLQQQIADKWLAVLQLQDSSAKKFVELSLGAQRMVMIARAMVKHPLLLILDEPTTGLDDKNALLLVSFINKIAAESKTAIIYVSHKHEEGLQPNFNFVLEPSEHGSTGKVVKL